MAKNDKLVRRVKEPFERQRVKTAVGEESLAKQEFREESDINNIMRKYEEHGEIPHVRSGGQFVDCDGPDDYQSALNIVMAAQERFAAMPARIRDRFDNNPELLLRFVADDENYDEAVELGLIEKPIEASVEPEAAEPPPDTSGDVSPAEPAPSAAGA